MYVKKPKKVEPIAKLKRKNNNLKESEYFINWKNNKIHTQEYTFYFSSGMSKILDAPKYFKNEIENIMEEVKQEYGLNSDESEFPEEVYTRIQEVVEEYISTERGEKKLSSIQTIEDVDDNIDLDHIYENDFNLKEMIGGE